MKLIEKTMRLQGAETPCHIEGCSQETWSAVVLKNGTVAPLCWNHSEWNKEPLGNEETGARVLLESEEEVLTWNNRRREMAFEQLEKLGCKYAYVGYYGGHDDGYVEPILLFAWYTEDPNSDDPLQMLQEDESWLATALAEPTYEQMGDAWWDGEPELCRYHSLWLWWKITLRSGTSQSTCPSTSGSPSHQASPICSYVGSASAVANQLSSS